MQRIFRSFDFILPILFGVASFLLVVGPLPLEPTNIGWLNGLDPSTHYLGWEFFRYSPWTLPLGLNPSYGYSIGSSIMYSDSIPIMAIPFKVFGPYLPKPFQYIGLWTLICFILQAWFSWKLSKLISQDLIIRLLICGLLGIFAPPLLKRLGLHAALLGQFLLLAGLYLNLRPQNNQRLLCWLSLLVAASLINFYLLVMIITLWLANVMDQWINHKKITLVVLLKEFVICSLAVIFSMWQAGFFLGKDAPIRAEGFGSYKLNLLSLFDANHWSYVLPNIATPEDLGEGFNYLGLGLICLLPLSIFLIFSNRASLYPYIKRFPFLIFAFIGLTVFALSNLVSIGMYTVEMPWPSALTNLASILRSSGRLFWPVYYGLVFLILAIIAKNVSRKWVIIFFTSALMIQIVDTRAGWWPLHQTFNELSKRPFPNPLNDPFWASAAKQYKAVINYPLIDNQAQINWQPIAYYAASNQLATNAVYLGRRPGTASVAQFNAQIEAQMKSGEYDQTVLYILYPSPQSNYPNPIQYAPQKDFYGVVNGLTVLAPNWQGKTPNLAKPN